MSHKVGYKKPPIKNQFKKGKSGNPNGKPKKPKNQSSMALLDQELGTTVSLQENGRQMSLTKEEALFKRIINGALSGDLKFLNALSRLLPKLLEYREKQREELPHSPILIIATAEPQSGITESFQPATENRTVFDPDGNLLRPEDYPPIFFRYKRNPDSPYGPAPPPQPPSQEKDVQHKEAPMTAAAPNASDKNTAAPPQQNHGEKTDVKPSFFSAPPSKPQTTSAPSNVGTSENGANGQSFWHQRVGASKRQEKL